MIKALLLALFFIPFSSDANCISSSILGQGQLTSKFALNTNAPYGFMEYLPPSYKRGQRKWPLIIMLHGVGERGDGNGDLNKLLKYGPIQRVSKGREFPAIIIAPQTSERWNSKRLMDLIEYSFNHYSVDKGRIYMTGVSMGGGGTWDFIRNFRGVLAAAIPICGAATANMGFEEGQALSELPIYAVHNADDDIVKLSATIGFAQSYEKHRWSRNQFMDDYQSADMTAHFDDSTHEWIWVNKSRALKPDMTFSVAIDQFGGHDSWTKTYESEATWEWLFCQSRPE